MAAIAGDDNPDDDEFTDEAAGRTCGREDMRTGDLGKLCAATIAVITSGTAGRGLEILQPSPEPGGVDAEVCAAEALAGVEI